MSEPIRDVETAVAKLGALPMPMGTEPQLTPERLAEIRDLIRYESSIAFYSHRAKESILLLVAEAEEAARLQARVVELEAGLPVMQKALFRALDRVSELEAERHTTNDALSDVTLAQRAAEGRPADEYPIRYALTEKAEEPFPPYGGHDPRCAYVSGMTSRCTCAEQAGGAS